MSNEIAPQKDETQAHPVPNAWRETFFNIVKAIAAGDYDRIASVKSVAPVSSAIARQIRSYIADYGETLTELSDESWNSSISQWTGTHWDVLVDLWTEESGASDLVLSTRVFEVAEGFRFEIDSVHVP